MLLAADIINSYTFIIAVSLVVILSYCFNLISKKTNIPSVLLLIVAGVFIKLGVDNLGFEGFDFFPLLEVLGIVGLIMIVLEAALELELKKEKIGMIGKATLVALLCLLGSSFSIAGFLLMFNDMTFLQALIYATPLSVMSSAIIIPSVNNLSTDNKEFLIYDGTLSDILGIMMFYFLLNIAETGEVEQASLGFIGNTLLTVLVALVSGYVLVVLFHKISTHVKMFLLMSILFLLYSTGKLLHLSPLIIILIFGLMLANRGVFFRGPAAKWIRPEKAEEVRKDFFTITIESAFVVRTFFFVVFGMTITLASLLNIEVLFESSIIVALLYLIRFVFLKLFVRGDVMTKLWVAPRGLITILLFFVIPTEIAYVDFNNGILLFVIIATSIIMTIALIGAQNGGAIEDGDAAIDNLNMAGLDEEADESI